MKEIELILKKLSFEEKEAAIYIQCLAGNNNNPTTIAKAVGIKRTTVYYYLDRLEAKGLINYKIKGKRKIINALPLKKSLREYLSSQQEHLAAQEHLVQKLPEDKTVNLSVDDTEVYYYEGKEGALAILNKIIESKTNFFWMGSIDTILSIIDEERLYKFFTLKRLKQNTSSFAITDKKINAFPRFSELLGNFRSLRFLPNTIETPALLILFNDTIHLISVNGKKIKTVIIEDKNMYEMVMLLFHACQEEIIPADTES